ncbi:MAG: hypothetical protein ACSLE6_05605 [Mycobacterium sp.]
MTSARRGIRAGVDDRWMKTVRGPDGRTEAVKSGRYGVGKRWRARYVPEDGQERSKMFDRKVDAQQWLDREITPAIAAGTYVTPQAGAPRWPMCSRGG